MADRKIPAVTTSIDGGRRCRVHHADGDAASSWDWWVGTSPRNGDGASVEGDWSDWISIGENIAVEDGRANGDAAAATMALIVTLAMLRRDVGEGAYVDAVRALGVALTNAGIDADSLAGFKL